MTEKHLRGLVALWQQRLGLGQWDIKVQTEDCPHDEFAHVDYHQRYDQAMISFAPWTLGQGDVSGDPLEKHFLGDELTEIKVVHELLHLVFRDLKAIPQYDLDGLVHRDALEVINASLLRADEHAIDNLARALVRNWPR